MFENQDFTMRAIIPLFILLILSSCTKRIYVPIETKITRIDTLYKARWHYDSIVTRDTIRIEKRGDTMYVDRVSYVDRNRGRVDTIIRYRDRDVIKEIPKEVEKIKEVNKLHWWQKTLMWIGVVAILFIIFVIYRICKAVWRR